MNHGIPAPALSPVPTSELALSKSVVPLVGARRSKVTPKAAVAPVRVRPKKPHPDFPLFPHLTGRWAKKIRGRFEFFGPWSDPQGALERWLEQKDELLAGRVPKSRSGGRGGRGGRERRGRRDGVVGGTLAHVAGSVGGSNEAPSADAGAPRANVAEERREPESRTSPGNDGFTIRDLVNHFLTAKKRRVDSGDMTSRSFSDYHFTSGILVSFFGAHRQATDLDSSDFGRLRAKLAETRGPVSLASEIGRVRSVFKFGYDANLLDRPMRFGPEFVKPPKRAMRQAKHARAEQMFDPHEIKVLLAEAGPQMKAMILLGLNAGLGNTDVASLPKTAVNLKKARLDFPRPKTGVARRAVLWPETVAALKVVEGIRPPAKVAGDDKLVFITKYGRPWVKVDPPKRVQVGLKVTARARTVVVKDAVSLEFGKLMRATKTHVTGRGFYALRHTFRTVADEIGDRRAIDLIMGHENGNDISAHYVERIGDERLEKVVEHVRRWALPIHRTQPPRQPAR